MLKKFIFTAFLACFALSANAQIATPQLDASWHTYGGAAAGWRYGNTIAFTGLSVEGKVESDGSEVGDIVAGLNAGGPEDSPSPVPFALAAFRGENFAGELYSNLGDGLKTDIEIDGVANVEAKNQYTEEKELRVNLAYVIGETVSIGLGYSSENDILKEELKSAAAGHDYEINIDMTTLTTSISASVRLAEIFFVAAGMESVKQTGTYNQEGTVSSTATNVDLDFSENSWTNTIFGLGVIIGDPGDTQFRAEYSMISSPESEEKDDPSEANSIHQQTNTSFISAEVKFGDFLIAYNNETEVQAELSGLDETESVKTTMGIGWVPLEGLTISAYSLNSKRTEKKDTGDDIVNPTGWQIFVGYNF